MAECVRKEMDAFGIDVIRRPVWGSPIKRFNNDLLHRRHLTSWRNVSRVKCSLFVAEESSISLYATLLFDFVPCSLPTPSQLIFSANYCKLRKVSSRRVSFSNVHRDSLFVPRKSLHHAERARKLFGIFLLPIRVLLILFSLNLREITSSRKTRIIIFRELLTGARNSMLEIKAGMRETFYMNLLSRKSDVTRPDGEKYFFSAT